MNPLSRRTLLRGGLGTAVALPFLEAMTPRRASAQGAAPPRRFVAVFGLMHGFVGRMDSNQGCYVPPWSATQAGPLPNNAFLKPFFDLGIASKMTNLVGLTDRQGSGAHAVAHGNFLARRRPACNEAMDNLTPTGVSVYGPTADQVAAAHLGQYTAIPYLCLDESYKGVGQGGFAPYELNLSWRTATQPVAADNNPRDVFDRLFAGYDPNATAAAVALRQLYRRSVLDFVKEDAARVRSRLGRSDQAKLAQYLDGVRELELRIEQSGAPPSKPAGAPPPVPGPGYFGDGTRPLRQRLLQDLIVKAFETDRTRVAVLRTQGAGSWLRHSDGSGLTNDHHTMSHWDQGANPAENQKRLEHMDIFTKWSLAMYAELLAKLDAVVDVDGSTALDNTVAMFGGEDADSHRHSWQSMSALVGGRGGRKPSGAWAINAGREVRFGKWLGSLYGSQNAYPPASFNPGERQMKDLLWGMLNMVAVPGLTGFGDATVPLDTELG